MMFYLEILHDMALTFCTSELTWNQNWPNLLLIMSLVFLTMIYLYF